MQFGINKHEKIFQRLTKFTSAYSFQIAREKSCDYLLIVYMKSARCYHNYAEATRFNHVQKKIIQTSALDQNNSFLSVKFKVQLRSSGNCLHQSVSESLSMKCNRRLRGLMKGEVLLLRLKVTVQLVKEFIRLAHIM